MRRRTICVRLGLSLLVGAALVLGSSPARATQVVCASTPPQDYHYDVTDTRSQSVVLKSVQNILLRPEPFRQA